MSESPDVSVIIVNWNTADTLVECLRSVEQEAARVALDVFVVDNASSDDSVASVQRDFPQATLIVNVQNVGFAAANNQALRLAQGRYLLLLNPDTVVRPGALRTLADVMDAHPEAGFAGPHLLNADGSTQPSARPLPTVWSELRAIVAVGHARGAERDLGRSGASTRPQEVGWVSGACLLIRQETVQRIGLLDEEFFLYFEETDWCTRARRQGWKGFYVPQADVVHHGMASTAGRVEPVLVRAYFNSRMHYFRKHDGPLTCLVLRGALLASSLAKLIVLAALGVVRRSERNRQAKAAHRLIVALALGRAGASSSD